MAHQKHQVTEMISQDEDDDRRLYECARKYEIIVKQFDELIGMMDNFTSIPKWQKSPRDNASNAKAVGSLSQPKSNDEIVKTLTRFLHELGANPTDSECSKGT
ncbi:hypothetical protein MTR_1g064480 [Medicago truncatula]|uniref:Uncharacterized protein n=1 Tax=Medicago truncatula TaxID=3880 RepID=A0A072VLC1_MEDTR|nr:hypothetical protein MTR_1g064480 [Medicago truncatula]